ncbi:hypothetical protein HanPSC8_Chr07g0300481 [Helianthus annuus]|nr:hypothetical protein HanPSC8_Chr07g0300481 [Helianthus annuus]
MILKLWYFFFLNWLKSYFVFLRYMVGWLGPVIRLFYRSFARCELYTECVPLRYWVSIGTREEQTYFYPSHFKKICL